MTGAGGQEPARERPAQGRPLGLFCGLTVLDVIQLVDQPPGPDEKVTALDQVVAAGGPATNAAVTFAALGGRAVLAAPVGQGPAAALVRADLEAHGVELVDCAAAAGPAAAGPPGTGSAAFPAGAQAVSPVMPGSRGLGDTRGSGPPSTSSCWQGSLSVSSCTVSARTAQRSVVSTNARLPTDPEPLRRLARQVEQGREALPDVVLVDGHNPDLARAALDVAEAAGARQEGAARGAVVGSGGALRIMDAGSWKDDAADLIARCDVVAASARFYPPGAALPAGCSHGWGASPQGSAGEVPAIPDEVAAWLLGRAVPAVVVTQGGQEALWWCAHEAAQERGAAGSGGGACGARRGSVRPPQVRAVDTLGAGDVFHGALARALALATPPAGSGVRLSPGTVSEAVRWSCEIAALSTTSMGTRAWLDRLRAARAG